MGAVTQIKAGKFPTLVQNRNNYAGIGQQSGIVPEDRGLTASGSPNQQKVSLFQTQLLHLLEQLQSTALLLSCKADIHGSDIPQACLLSIVENRCSANTYPVTAFHGNIASADFLLKTVDRPLTNTVKNFIQLFAADWRSVENTECSVLHPKRSLVQKNPQLRDFSPLFLRDGIGNLPEPVRQLYNDLFEAVVHCFHLLCLSYLMR